MRITVLHTPTSKFGPFTVVYALATWPAGTRRNRGWESTATIYVREATPTEVEEARTCPRMISYRYRSWAALVADEAKYGVDAEALVPARYKEVTGAGATAAAEAPEGYSLEREVGQFGFIGRYLVLINGETVGQIDPIFAGRESSRITGYRTHVELGAVLPDLEREGQATPQAALSSAKGGQRPQFAALAGAAPQGQTTIRACLGSPGGMAAPSHARGEHRSHDSGFPNEYRTLAEAKDAVDALMRDNGILPAAKPARKAA